MSLPKPKAHIRKKDRAPNKTLNRNLLTLRMQEVEKAHATRKLAGRIDFGGLKISLEHQVGDVRKGKDRDGHEWRTVMKHRYGYVLGTEGVDGDHLDVFLANVDEDRLIDRKNVYIIHQCHPGTTQYDEDKVMIGFWNARDAIEAYLSNYDRTDHFGAITEMDVNDFVKWCQDKENRGEMLNPKAPYLIHLNHRRKKKLQKLRQDYVDWMKGVIKHHDVEEERRPSLQQQFMRGFDQIWQAASGGKDLDPYSVGKALPVEDETGQGRRLIRIIPSWEAVDLQGEYISKEEIIRAWPYYEENGNIDLEHLTKKGGRTYQEYVSKLREEGFDISKINPAMGRTYFEIGRPVKGSFNEEDCSFLAEIYQGTEVADEFWHSLKSGWKWKPSVGGKSARIPIEAEVGDPMLGYQGKRQVNVMLNFRWNNVAMTLEPVNHYTRPVEIVSHSQYVMKGISMKESTIKATEILRRKMVECADSVIQDMQDTEQLSTREALDLKGEVLKAVGLIDDKDYEVSKALGYGEFTTDMANLTDGGAATWSDFKKKRVLKALWEEGPFLKGFSFSQDEEGDEPGTGMLVDIADFILQEYEDCCDEDAMEIAEDFLRKVLEG